MEYVPGRDLKAVLQYLKDPEGVHATISCTLGHQTTLRSTGLCRMEKMIQMADHSASFIEM